jgi:hypothetical protein
MPETVVASTGSSGGTGVGRLTVGRLKVSRSTLKVPLRCTGGPCDTTLRLTTVEILNGSKVIAASVAKRRHKVVTVATASITLRAAQSKTIQLALNTTGKRLLARFHRLPATLTVSESRTVVVQEPVAFRARTNT